MAAVAVLVTNLFEDSEYIHPTDAFRKAGHRVIPIGVTAGETVWGKTDHTPVAIERAVAESSVDDFDALLIPGGYSPDKLRVDAAVVAFVHDFVASGKPVFLICHAPQLLITAQVLSNRTVTGYASIVQDIRNAGATYVDAEVVEDGNLISSRNPGDLAAFTRAALRRLAA
ncbi:MAG: type 1 glutamine amidotransferase [Methanomicrobiales archaeon]|nr:type 1 glutamine amidotransferase [Methanomicrobiales archaeon]